MATFWSRCACISIETVLTYPSCQLLVLAAKLTSPVDGDLGESLLIYEKQHELRAKVRRDYYKNVLIVIMCWHDKNTTAYL